MKKTALLLALLMIVLPLGSCAEKTADEETVAPVTADVVPETEAPAETEIPDNLPEKDFEGADFRIYTRSCCKSHTDGVYMPEQTERSWRMRSTSGT